MHLRWLTLFVLVLISTSVYSQFNMEDYLANAISDEELQFSKAKQDFLDENKFNSPILREVEFRARIRNFGEGFGDYRLRFSPINPFEKKANKEYHTALRKQIEAEYRMNLEEVFLSRYLLMIEHIKLSERLIALEVEDDFYQSALQVTQNQTNSSALKDYIALDKAHLKTTIDLQKTHQEIDKIEQTIKYTYDFNTPIVWQSSTIIEIEEIRNWLTSTNPGLENNLYLMNEIDKETLDALDYKIEKNQAFSNLGYVQAEYREDANNAFGENMGLQIAVNIPVVNPDKPDLQRQKFEILEDSKKLALERKELEQYLNSHYTNLINAFAQYDLVSAKMKIYDEKSFAITNPNNTLDLMIELREFKSDLASLKTNSAAEIRSLFIELLSLNGELSRTPYVNYLSKDRSSFELKN